MDTFWAIIFICLASSLAAINNISMQEGSDHTLSCSITDDNGFTAWTLNRPLDQGLTSSVPLAICNHFDYNCTNHKLDQFTATTVRNRAWYTSELTINEVTPDLRGQEISCTEYRRTSASTDTVQTWSLEVYYPPEAPKCKAGLTDSGDMYVNCSTSRVYPGLRCRISQKGECEVSSADHQCRRRTEKRWNTVPSAHSSIYIEEALYYTAQCYIVFNPKRIGEYKFYVELYPKITDPFSVTPVKKHTNRVTVRSLHSETTADGLKKTSQEGPGNQSPSSVTSEHPVSKSDRGTTANTQKPSGKGGTELTVPATTQRPSETNIATEKTRYEKTTLVSAVEVDSKKVDGFVIVLIVIGVVIVVVILVFCLVRKRKRWVQRSDEIIFRSKPTELPESDWVSSDNMSSAARLISMKSLPQN